jgi:DNA topoisomerase IA
VSAGRVHLDIHALFFKRPGATYIKNYDFSYRIPPNPAFHDFTVTSVAGHLISTDFPQDYKKWNSCDPFALFDAPITEYVETVSPPLWSFTGASIN